MRLIKGEKYNTLKADENMLLRNVNDVYEPEHTDDEGNYIKEHFPYYFKECDLPIEMTLEKIQELYVEENV